MLKSDSGFSTCCQPRLAAIYPQAALKITGVNSLGSPMSEYIAWMAGRWIAAALLSLVLAPPTLLRAQQGLVVSARIQAPAFKLSSADSGKLELLLRISGVSETRRRALKANEITIVGVNGMRYVPSAVILTSNEEARRSLLAQYTDLARGRMDEPQYVFLVPRGATAFELRLPSRDPIPFTAAVSLVRR